MNIESIKAKLKNYSKQHGKIHQNTLTKFFQERFLYRLSQSRFKENFLLKGGALAYSLSREDSRHTKDIDFLIKKHKVDQDEIKSTIKAICEIQENDGVLFKTKNIKVEEIQKEGNYKGIRIKVEGRLGRTIQQIQIDIGVGDHVTPGPQEITFPTILKELPAPILKAYSVETLISEKFNAMIDLGEFNSRLKDFYDIYKLVDSCDEEILEEAVKNTFKRRKTITVKNHSIFQKEFFTNKQRLKQWNIFLEKNQLEKIDFKEVGNKIQSKLKPIFEKL